MSLAKTAKLRKYPTLMTSYIRQKFRKRLESFVKFTCRGQYTYMCAPFGATEITFHTSEIFNQRCRRQF